MSQRNWPRRNLARLAWDVVLPSNAAGCTSLVAPAVGPAHMGLAVPNCRGATAAAPNWTTMHPSERPLVAAARDCSSLAHLAVVVIRLMVTRETYGRCDQGTTGPDTGLARLENTSRIPPLGHSSRDGFRHFCPPVELDPNPSCRTCFGMLRLVVVSEWPRKVQIPNQQVWIPQPPWRPA